MIWESLCCWKIVANSQLSTLVFDALGRAFELIGYLALGVWCCWYLVARVE